MGVAIGTLHFEDTLFHFEHGDIECTGSEVVDGDDRGVVAVET